MAQRQFTIDDTSPWPFAYGSSINGVWTPTTTTLTPIDATCTGTISTRTLPAVNASFAAGQLILIHQTYGSGAGGWELNRIESYLDGVITTSFDLTQNYVTGAQVLVMPQYASVDIASGQTITGKSWNGSVGGITAFFSNGLTNIAGSLTANGVTGVGSSPNNNNITVGGGFRGGGGWRATNDEGISGDGTGGLRAQVDDPGGNAGGGGRQSGGDSGGGGGGNGGAGSNGSSNSGTGGIGGDASGNAALTNMNLGGGGGGGRTDDAEGGHGGSGGGIILIITRTIAISGSLTSNGGSGYSVLQACGGGGAGGSILIKCQSGTLGSGIVQAVGGGGGATGGSQSGGNGGTGRIHVDYLTSLTGTTSPALDSSQDSSLVNRPTGAAVLAGFLST